MLIDGVDCGDDHEEKEEDGDNVVINDEGDHGSYDEVMFTIVINTDRSTTLLCCSRMGDDISSPGESRTAQPVPLPGILQGLSRCVWDRDG